jgi:hypothetical protein
VSLQYYIHVLKVFLKSECFGSNPARQRIQWEVAQWVSGQKRRKRGCPPGRRQSQDSACAAGARRAAPRAREKELERSTPDAQSPPDPQLAELACSSSNCSAVFSCLFVSVSLLPRSQTLIYQSVSTTFSQQISLPRFLTLRGVRRIRTSRLTISIGTTTGSPFSATTL